MEGGVLRSTRRGRKLQQQPQQQQVGLEEKQPDVVPTVEAEPMLEAWVASGSDYCSGEDSLPSPIPHSPSVFVKAAGSAAAGRSSGTRSSGTSKSSTTSTTTTTRENLQLVRKKIQHMHRVRERGGEDAPVRKKRSERSERSSKQRVRNEGRIM